MADLDLDAIRRRLNQATKVYGDTLDCAETHSDGNHEATCQRAAKAASDG